MPIGYRADMAAVNNAAGAQAVKLRDWVAGALSLQAEVTNLGGNAAAQATALVAMGFTQTEADAIVYEVGAMHEAALILSGDLAKPDPFDYLNATANLTGFGRSPG